MTRIDVRDATPDDLTELAGIFRRASLSNHADRAMLLAHPEFLLLPDDLLTQRDTVVATRPDGERLGFASTRRLTDGALELEDLFVEPHWMRRGVARTLMAEIARRASHAGASRIEVTANTHAMPFYRSAGFEDAGEAQTEAGPAPRMHLAVGSG